LEFRRVLFRSNYSSPLPFLPFYFTPGDHRPVSRKQRIGLDYRTQMRQKIHQRYNDHIFDITIMIITQEYEQIYKRGHSHQNIEKTVVDKILLANPARRVYREEGIW